MNVKFWMTALGVSLSLLSFQANTYADEYPTRPIQLIVGFSAGGATDVSARLFAKHIGEYLGQSVVVENRPGAAGTISADYVSRSKPDGYTLLYTSSSIHAISPHIYPNLGWDPINDFMPIALTAKYPQVLLANNDISATTLSELAETVRLEPGKLAYASAGVGGTQHMAAALMSAAGQLDMVHIPYKGMSAAYPDLIGNRVQVMFDNAPSAIPFVKDGKVKALAVSSKARVSSLPDVPTLQESGFGDLDINAWTGVVAPAGTPLSIVEKLNQAIRHAAETTEVKTWLEDNGSPTDLSASPQEFAHFIESELAFWKHAVEISGASQQ